MGTALVVVTVLIALVVYFSKGHGTKYAAAKNALLAKVTFERMAPGPQQKVRQQAVDILLRGGIQDAAKYLDQMPPAERSCFFALAMNELGIQPVLPGEQWQLIPNPFIALTNAEKETEVAKRQLKEQHGLDISF